MKEAFKKVEAAARLRFRKLRLAARGLAAAPVGGDMLGAKLSVAIAPRLTSLPTSSQPHRSHLFCV